VNCFEVVSRYFSCRTEENHLNFSEGNRGLNLRTLERKAGLLPAGKRLLTDANDFSIYVVKRRGTAGTAAPRQRKVAETV
jgi:hypothetical protein